MGSELPIYLLAGMTRDDNIFDKLIPLLPNCTVIRWFEPHADESIGEYAKRMAALIPTSQCYIAGVSFGGIVAIEVSRIVHPRGCFVISSITDPSQLPPWLRIWRLMAGRSCQQILNAIGQLAIMVPKRIRTPSTARVTKLAGHTGAWHRWATSAVLGWQPDRPLPPIPLWQIHGDCDTTFPIRYTDPHVVVHTGGHDLPLTHPMEVAEAMSALIAGAA